MLHEIAPTLHAVLSRTAPFSSEGSQVNAEKWPDLAEEALYGLAGDIVRTIEPYTEAHPVAVLTNSLVAFGNAVGSSPYFQVEKTKHHSRLFAALVGETSKGRKGTSWSTPKYLISLVDPEWAETRIGGGLSSGEGVIYNVRDERRENRPIKEKNRIVGYQEEVVDQGVTDKRLLVVEEELASALKVMEREGNILSPTLRQAWDSGDLRPMTKNNPIKASGAHISILSHITRTELLRHLRETEKANGFANRFIWLMVKRTKEIPNPTGVPDEILTPLAERLKIAIQFSRSTCLVGRDEEAEGLWSGIYSQLSKGRPGMVGAITGRAEAQVMRLAMIYALMDNSNRIRAVHLKAALALWDYAEASVSWIFGQQLGDPTTDRIIEALRSSVGGLSETEIRDLFGRHKSANEVQRSLSDLNRMGLAQLMIVPTEGRSRSVWRATKAT